jgi:hypothetical protein
MQIYPHTAEFASKNFAASEWPQTNASHCLESA